MAKHQSANRYTRIIERIFLSKHKSGVVSIPFTRDEIVEAAKTLRIKLPKNLGDVIYSFRFRTNFPESVRSRAPKGKVWIIRLAGKGKYLFAANSIADVSPQQGLVVTKIPDATPGIVVRYAMSDEQALLAKLRYNRLIDIFTGSGCYSLQSHLRTTVADLGQVETDEIYIGVDKRGAHYAFPIQAKGGKDRQNIVQIEQDFAICNEKFPDLICRPIAAQFMDNDVIALLEFSVTGDEISIARERHYRLVPQDSISTQELETYRMAVDD